MASFFLAPDPVQSTFFIPGGAIPGAGAQLFIYVAGSVSTKTTVYKDNAGNAAWSNPIVLDSGGNLPNGGVVWIPSGVSIKAVWAPSNDTDPPSSPYRTIDNIAGINDTTGSQTEWIAGPTPTFVSGTQFTLVGDQTANFTKARRLKFTVTAGTVYGAITNSTFGALTTVNVVFASGALDSGLNAVSYSLIAPDNPSINADYVFKQASSVASAGNGTTNIWGVAGNSVHITGTNAIFNFSTAPYPGASRRVIFDSALSLNSSAAITMAANANVVTAANDRAEVYAETTSTSVVTFYKQSGKATIDQAAIASGRNIAARTNSGTPNTKLDITADEFILKDSNNNAFQALGVSGSIDFTSTGVNALDTGTQSTSVFYYGYVIANPAGSTAVLGSLSSSSPTLPAGYTFKALATAAKSGAGPAFLKYRQVGNIAHYDTINSVLSSAGINTIPSAVSLSNFVPPIALEGILHVSGQATAGAGSISANAQLRVVSSTATYEQSLLAAAASGATTWGYKTAVPNISQQVFVVFDNTTNFANSNYLVDVLAFKLPLGGE